MKENQSSAVGSWNVIQKGSLVANKKGKAKTQYIHVHQTSMKIGLIQMEIQGPSHAHSNQGNQNAKVII